MEHCKLLAGSVAVRQPRVSVLSRFNTEYTVQFMLKCPPLCLKNAPLKIVIRSQRSLIQTPLRPVLIAVVSLALRLKRICSFSNITALPLWHAAKTRFAWWSMFISTFLLSSCFGSMQQTIECTTYDTIYLRVLRSWRDGQFNLAYDTNEKNKEN